MTSPILPRKVATHQQAHESRLSDPPTYFPGPGDDWKAVSPVEMGMDATLLDKAIAFAEAHETTSWTREMVGEDGQYQKNSVTGVGEGSELIGPVKPRGGPNGVILRHGRIVAEWGDSRRVDMTFSISKSYLAIIAGLAVSQGLIANVHDTVHSYGLDDGFSHPQNRNITWHHLLTQTSEWEGTMWGKADLLDRNRAVSGDDSRRGTLRELNSSGSYWEYNDVRVNRLSLSLLQLFRKPLEKVLKEQVMDPIGASDQWEWPAYFNATVDIDGESMSSIPGGGHWGGGLWISSRDHARFGHLILNQGWWNDREILPSGWIEHLSTPATGNPHYGYLWWLNPGHELLSVVPENCLLGNGGGTNLLLVDPEHDLVLVSRWVDSEHWSTLCGYVMDSCRT